ncbi:hypothetical protein GMORB2_2324 [Geosmithia morbida]|uniref:Restriction of telomere capping protein 4 n=1 Tax=Geosmithia morbida TaxID=1094350 RepID=A0A9P4YRT0_9HYPO|nr:uncharacterized protein GMORB2_2324 [Geosmithia morbida]KAF4121362.1 hypothetical protein GMORB2_2324 [Geosmithia morbida]
MPIRTGLSYGNRPKPLLSMVGGKPRAACDGKPSTRGPATDIGLHSTPAQSPEKTDRSASPDGDSGSTEKKAGERRAPSQFQSFGDSSDEDDEGIPRGSIAPTSFGSGKRAAPPSPGVTRPTEDAKGNADGAKRRRLGADVKASPSPGDQTPKSSQPKSSQPESSQESSSTRPPASSGEHMVDSLGFTKKSRVKATFGAKGTKGTKGTKGLARKFGQVGAPPDRKSKPKPTKGNTHTYGMPPPSSFIPPPSSDIGSPPPPEGERAGGFKSLAGLSDSSAPDSPKSKFEANTEADDSDPSTLTPPRKTKPAKKKATGNPISRARISADNSDDDEQSKRPPPVFKTFDDDDDDAVNLPVRKAAGSESETATSDILSDHDEPAADATTTTATTAAAATTDATTSPRAAVCPWCGEAVDALLLQDFSRGQKRLNVRQQTRFCRRHKNQKAADMWSARSYPSIDWDALSDRIAGHHDFLLSVIDGSTPSHYRDALASKIESGQDRALKREENLNPGYYGPRGFNLMCDRLVDRFSDMLKQRAVHDRVISGRGSAAFIQSVLVAELGVQLIKEDMGVSADEATKILEESKGIGEMIHEE